MIPGCVQALVNASTLLPLKTLLVALETRGDARMGTASVSWPVLQVDWAARCHVSDEAEKCWHRFADHSPLLCALQTSAQAAVATHHPATQLMGQPVMQAQANARIPYCQITHLAALGSLRDALLAAVKVRKFWTAATVQTNCKALVGLLTGGDMRSSSQRLQISFMHVLSIVSRR